MISAMPTIYDVAKRAGVSTYTVSVVLNRSARVSAELTERVLQAVRELDYTPNEVARSLQTRRSRTVAMLIPDIANPFYAMVVRGVEDRLKQDGYSLLLGNTYNRAEEQARYLSVFRARQADGVLIFLAAGGDEDVQKLTEAGKPVVCVARAPQSVNADVVMGDSRTGTRLAIDHLLSRGHNRIALVLGQLAVSSTAERLTGWRQSMKAAGLRAPREYAIDTDWTQDGGRDAMLRLLDLAEPPTAVFAANFLILTGVLAALRERGIRCPDQIEVAASDESEWLDVFDPPVTTVVQPSYSLGERAADLLLKRLADPSRPTERIVLQPSLHVRTGTVAA